MLRLLFLRLLLRRVFLRLPPTAGAFLLAGAFVLTTLLDAVIFTLATFTDAFIGAVIGAFLDWTELFGFDGPDPMISILGAGINSRNLDNQNRSCRSRRTDYRAQYANEIPVIMSGQIQSGRPGK